MEREHGAGCGARRAREAQVAPESDARRDPGLTTARAHARHPTHSPAYLAPAVHMAGCALAHNTARYNTRPPCHHQARLFRQPAGGAGARLARRRVLSRCNLGEKNAEVCCLLIVGGVLRARSRDSCVLPLLNALLRFLWWLWRGANGGPAACRCLVSESTWCQRAPGLSALVCAASGESTLRSSARPWPSRSQ